MKILSIGNSFSQDAHKWLHKLANANGINLETYNLYIGGCSLETHWKNYEENNAYYDFEINGNGAKRKISILEALKFEKWDVITLQQVSNFSGMFETYEPYLSSLASVIRKEMPDVKLYIHQTWAYEIDCRLDGFPNYNNNQLEMYERIVEAVNEAATAINAKVIYTGKVIQTLRDTLPEFDYKNGGLSLCRDSYHLSLDYGRFAAAATWLYVLTGNKIKITDFEDFNPELLNKILEVVCQ